MSVISRPPGFRLGDLLPGFGYGCCFRCHRPWWACTPQVVEIGAGRGQFALCVGCWRRASRSERVEAHRWVSVRTRPGDVDKILEMVKGES